MTPLGPTPAERLSKALRHLEETMIEVCPVGPAKQQALRKLEELKALAKGAVGDDRDSIRKRSEG